MRLVQFADFGLILAYASFFSTLAVYEYARMDAWRFLPVLAACSAWFTAAFDYRENVSILQTLDMPRCAMIDALVRNTRRLSLTKWASLAVTLALLAPGLILQVKTIPVVGGVVCALAGITGLIGVFKHRWLRESTSLFACLVLGVLAVCLISGSM